ncbi:MAG: hypothetical protein ACRD0K_09285 [Egibacteraceae bacterium]
MTTETPGAASTALFKGGPTLIDLLIDVTQLRIIVTGPRMLFENLELLTTLSAFEGTTVQRLRDLAGCLEATIHCGLVGIQRAEITVVTVRSGGVLRIGLGPPSMYQSEMVLRTKTGETFRALIQRLLLSDSADPAQPFFVGLHPVTATGHLEHHQDHGAHHGGGDHGHP